MGETHPLLARFQAVKYTPTVWGSGMDTSGYRPAGVKAVISLLNAAKSELEITAEIEGVIETDETDEQRAIAAEQGRVFIVHGHDAARKHELARLLTALVGTQPVILHEEPNNGRVLIEKFEQTASAAGYAVVLLTGDDLGRAVNAHDERPRARQNVVFEMGFFIAAFGRDHVAVLVDDGVERPSDIDGIVYIQLDSAGAWKTKIATELDSAGMAVDWAGLRGA